MDPAVTRARLGQDSAPDFDGFFGSQYPSLAGALVLLTGDREEAEDLAQEAMARVYERWDRVGGMESPAGYAFRTALNLNRKRLRRLAVRARKVLLGPSEEDPAEKATTRTDVRRAMLEVPRGQREALVLVGWLGLTAEEAGRVLGIDAASVRSRLSRGRATLQGLLGEHDE